jgi:hypothetical protein
MIVKMENDWQTVKKKGDKDEGFGHIQPTPVLQDMNISCSWCKKDFIFPVKDQKYFKNKSFDIPKKCKDCRLKKKQIFADKQAAAAATAPETP